MSNIREVHDKLIACGIVESPLSKTAAEPGSAQSAIKGQESAEEGKEGKELEQLAVQAGQELDKEPSPDNTAKGPQDVEVLNNDEVPEGKKPKEEGTPMKQEAMKKMASDVDDQIGTYFHNADIIKSASENFISELADNIENLQKMAMEEEEESDNADMTVDSSKEPSSGAEGEAESSIEDVLPPEIVQQVEDQITELAKQQGISPEELIEALNSEAEAQMQSGALPKMASEALEKIEYEERSNKYDLKKTAKSNLIKMGAEDSVDTDGVSDLIAEVAAENDVSPEVVIEYLEAALAEQAGVESPASPAAPAASAPSGSESEDEVVKQAAETVNILRKLAEEMGEEEEEPVEGAEEGAEAAAEAVTSEDPSDAKAAQALLADIPPEQLAQLVEAAQELSDAGAEDEVIDGALTNVATQEIPEELDKVASEDDIDNLGAVSFATAYMLNKLNS